MKARRSSILISFAVVALSSAVCPTAYAQGSPADTATAQALYDQAKKLMAEGNYTDACPKLEESQRLDPGSGTLLNLGDCYEHQGKIATAWGKFVEAAAVAKSANQVERERVSRDRAAAVLVHVSNIVINVAGGDTTPGLEVRRDGAAVGKAQWGTPIPADPGDHTVSASAQGRKPWESTIKVGTSGGTLTVSVPELEPIAPPAPATPEISTPAAPAAERPEAPTPETTGGFKLDTQRTVALGAAGIGIAGIVVGSVFGLKSMSRHNIAAQACPNHPECPSQDEVVLWNWARSAGNVSTGAFIVGLTGIGAGVALWFTAPSASRSATGPRAVVGVGSVALTGTW